MNVKILSLACVLCAALPAAALAQFGNLMKSATGSGDQLATQAVSKDDFLKLLQTTSGGVLTARIKLIDAQIDIMTALGLKTEALVKASEALRKSEGASSSPGDLLKAQKDAIKVTGDSVKEMNKSLEKSDKLSDESKVIFVQGTGKFVEAVILEKAQIETVMKLVDQGKTIMSSAGPMEKLKVAGLVKPASELAIMVPGDIKDGLALFVKITSFAERQNITLPNQKEAMDKLGGL